MRTIIHDIDCFDKIKSDDVIINTCEKNCIGCFNCWVKHPKICTFNDELKHFSDVLLSSDSIIIISKCVYGTYSANVKKILERVIGYVKPYFCLRNGRIHHQSRSNKKLNFIVYFYGNIDSKEKELARKLVNLNACNINSNPPSINFVNNIEEIGDI